MSQAIHHLINGELELFKQAINATLYSKVGQAFEEKKQEIAQEMFSEECMDCPKGKLKGKQHKLDKAKPFGKLTGADFKALRKGKK